MSKRLIILCTNLTVIHSNNLLHPLLDVLHWYTVKYYKNKRVSNNRESYHAILKRKSSGNEGLRRGLSDIIHPSTLTPHAK